MRRPIQARESRWAQSAARFLAARGVQPNWISIASVGFAALSGASLLWSSRLEGVGVAALYLAAALFIQARLLCNLFDGMVAVEGGLKTQSGEVFNDLPDRLADPLILIPAGYAVALAGFGPALGWLAGLLAVMTAYVRLLGGACGLAQRFSGPMAKQHRMAVMTAALVLAAVATPAGYDRSVLLGALVLIVLGCVVTLVRRTADIVRTLERG